MKFYFTAFFRSICYIKKVKDTRTGRLLLSLFIPFVAAIIGSTLTSPGLTSGYLSLKKPFFNPPPWLFGPVWLLLYFLMGLALYLTWVKKTKQKGKKKAIVFFLIQLFLNVLWPLLFFTLELPKVAFWEIIFLWFFVFKTYQNFKLINQTAGHLLLPYLIWISFALILNFSIVILNPAF